MLACCMLMVKALDLLDKDKACETNISPARRNKIELPCVLTQGSAVSAASALMWRVGAGLEV